MAGEGIRVEGRTVEEAIQRAAALLEALPEEMEVTVIDAGSQGFLSLGRRPAVIAAQLSGQGEESGAGEDAGRGAAAGEEGASSTATVLGPGYALVEGGQVLVGGSEPPPTIIPGEGFELFVNGQLISDQAVVRQGDTITVRPRVEEKPGTWKLVVTADGLAAKLIIKPGLQRTWRLVDQFPTPRLALKGTVVEKGLPVVTRDELLAELNRQQVVFGIDEAAIQQACAATEEMEIVVARGRPPGPPEDARIECLFSTSELAKKEVGEEERVDYREMVVRASAALGDLLAVKVPARPGEEGLTVTGKPIPAPEPKDLQLVAGKGTEVIDGQRVIARGEGRPQLRRRKGQVAIDIIPVLVHRGDVNLASGNLRFKGGISISGSVTETMQVVASQDVEIAGDVTQATVRAGGSILIHRNCIGSSLIAGGSGGIYQSAEPLLVDLAQQLSLLQIAATQVEQSARNQKGPTGALNTGYLLSVLVENKFKRLSSLVRKLEELTRGVEGGPEEQRLVQVGRELGQAFRNPSTIQGLNPARLAKLTAAVQELAAYCQEIPVGPGNISVSYALNSKIQASGSVTMTGRGCFNTDIVAGGRVEVKGVFRGGSIFAGNDVYIKEMGSSGGAKTLVRVAEGRLIKASKVWSNSTLQIGKRVRQIDNDSNQVMAYLNSEGDMVLGTF